MAMSDVSVTASKVRCCERVGVLGRLSCKGVVALAPCPSRARQPAQGTADRHGTQFEMLNV